MLTAHIQFVIYERYRCYCFIYLFKNVSFIKMLRCSITGRKRSDCTNSVSVYKILTVEQLWCQCENPVRFWSYRVHVVGCHSRRRQRGIFRLIPQTNLVEGQGFWKSCECENPTKLSPFIHRCCQHLWLCTRVMLTTAPPVLTDIAEICGCSF